MKRLNFEPVVTDIVNGEEVYGRYEVITDMPEIPGVKKGDIVYLWWVHEKNMEFVTAGGHHFFVSLWCLDQQVRKI